MKKKASKEVTEQKKITFKALTYECLPELWAYKFFTAIILGAFAWILNEVITFIAGVGGNIISTANFRDSLLSWRTPLLIILFIALIQVYILFEIFAQICLCDDILKGGRAGLWDNIKRGFSGIKRFMNPGGASILLYIFIAVPLCGIGFSISLTKNFYIPNFILDVVLTKPLTAIAYYAFLIFLICIGFAWIFSVHAVLIDGVTPKQAKKRSLKLIKKNRKEFILGLIKIGVILYLIRLVSYAILVVPQLILKVRGLHMEQTFMGTDYFNAFLNDEITDLDWHTIFYRILCTFAVLMGNYIYSIVILLTSAYFMLRFTKYYLDFSACLEEEEGAASGKPVDEASENTDITEAESGFDANTPEILAELSKEAELSAEVLADALEETAGAIISEETVPEVSGKNIKLYPERPKKKLYRTRVVILALTAVFVLLASCFIGAYYDIMFNEKEPVKIVAHRTGGWLASENSMEGIAEAIKYGCYGSETDTQRTKDQHYIINHDNDFKRLTGVARKPGDMTMEEIAELKIKDTTGNGNLLDVVKTGEMIDYVKDSGVVLFLELKGVSADRQMADDLVEMIHEKDAVDDVALISLNYDTISYIETNYPEIETGTLLFGAIGDISKMNCDMIMIEQEMATDARVEQIHDNDKKVFVWTINEEEDLYNMLDEEVDGVITDNVLGALEQQKLIDERTVIDLLNDKLQDIWEH